MSAKPVFTINTKDEVAALEIFVEEEFVTRYDYSDGVVTLSERLSVTVFSFEVFNEIIRQIKFFSDAIKLHLKPPHQDPTHYELEVKRDGGSILEYFVEINGDQVIDVIFNYISKDFTFQPRIELALNFRDFEFFHHALIEIVTEAQKVENQ